MSFPFKVTVPVIPQNVCLACPYPRAFSTNSQFGAKHDKEYAQYFHGYRIRKHSCIDRNQVFSRLRKFIFIFVSRLSSLEISK